MQTNNSLEKLLMLGKIEGKSRNRASEDEMSGWHYQSNEHEPGQTPRDGEGQGGLACCSPWSHRVGHDWATEQQQLCNATYKFRSSRNKYMLSTVSVGKGIMNSSSGCVQLRDSQEVAVGEENNDLSY